MHKDGLQYHILLVDTDMPEYDGLKLIKDLRDYEFEND